MDFKKTLQVQYNNWLRTLRDVPIILNEFSLKGSNFAKVDFMLELIVRYPVELFSGTFGKSEKVSKEIRNLGNKNYKGLLLDVALQDYTKSIAFAPSGSQELLLAYGNRAACLMEMNRFDLALEDVDRALTLSHIDEGYTNKLQSRKAECISKSNVLRTDLKSNEARVLLPSQSNYFSSGSLKLSLSTSNELGRHIVASDKIQTGEIIVIEKPYSKILLPDSYYTHCTHCFKETMVLIPCPSCITAMFCSEACKLKAQPYHDVECLVVERLNYLEVGKMVMLAMRIVLDASKSENNLFDLKKRLELTQNSSSEKYDSQDFLQIYKLVGNTDKRTSADLFYRTFTACNVVSSLLKFTNFFRDHQNSKSFIAGLLLHFIQSLPCNAHEITDFCMKQSVEIGAGAFATLSLLNHSCDPNVVRHSFGDTVVLRAIRMIDRGEEIVDNYGYHYATHGLNDRQTSLSRQYYFTCSCIACSNTWPLYNEIPCEKPTFKHTVDEQQFKKLFEDFEVNLNKVIQNEVSVESLDLLCQFLDYLDEHIERPWQVYNNCQEAIKHALHFLPNYQRQ